MPALVLGTSLDGVLNLREGLHQNHSEGHCQAKNRLLFRTSFSV